MSFPVTLTPSSPAGLDSPRLGDDEIRNLKSLLADLFTLPVSPSTISATIGSVSTGGKLTITNGVWTGDVVGRAYGGTGLSVAGTSGNLLTSDGTNWTSAAPPVVNHAILSATHTDSTAAAVVRGDLMVGIGVTPKWERVAKGAEGTIVRAGATEPAYTTATYPATTTINQLLYSSAASVITGLATGNSGLLVTDGTGVPSIGTDIPTAVTIGGAYAYRANGTDVAVADGGTSLSTIADAAILATNSANVLTAVVAGASQSIRRNAGNTAWEAFTPGAGAGTVTSVAQSFTGGLISVAGSPVTTSGTLALTVAGTSGGIPYFSGATTWASSGALTANALVLGGGAGAAPAPMGSLGTTTTLLHGNAAGAPTFGAVSLTADVTGILPTANGGTNIAYFTAAGPTAARVYTFPDVAGSVPLLAVANVFTANQTISSTAPSLILTDTTASAKSLTIAVDANIVNLRESAGASGSLLVLDLATLNVGIGTTTLDVWSSGHAATYLGRDATIAAERTGGANNALLVNQNGYFDGTNWKYIETSQASNYYQTNGTHVWRVAASGTAGNTIGWTTAMQIDNSGNVGIGITPTTKLHAYGADNSTVGTFEIAATSANVTAADTFIDFRSSNGSIGTIAGTATSGLVAYNTFTGSHYTQVEEADRAALKIGMLLEATGDSLVPFTKQTRIRHVDEKRSKDDKGNDVVTPAQDIEESFQASTPSHLVRSRISRTKGSKAAYGVWGGTDKEGRDMVLALGTGMCFVVNTGKSIEVGDYLMASDVPGAMEVQNDDVYRNLTVAKAMQVVAWQAGERQRHVACIYLGG